MKTTRFLCFILIFSLLFLSSCAFSDDELVGTYTCARLELDGEQFHVLDVYPNGCVLQLSHWGQAWLSVNGDRFYGRWELEENDFILDINSELSTGSLENGICKLRLSGNEMEHVFLREGASLPENVATVQPITEQQVFWNGDWYGYWTIENASGNWQDQSGQSFDCFARFEIDSNGLGKMTFWDEMQDSFHPVAVAQIAVIPDDNSDCGSLQITGGDFLDSKLTQGQWDVKTDGFDADSVFYLQNAVYTGTDASFEYSIILRPWGRTWEDIEATHPDILPYFYYDWYLPALASGERMPDSFEYSDKSVIRYTWNEDEQ